MPDFVCSPKLAIFLPDWKVGQREPDRNFLWTIANAVDPKYCSKLMTEAIRKRAAIRNAAKNADKPKIQLTEKVIDELLADENLHGKLVKKCYLLLVDAHKVKLRGRVF